MINIDTVSFFTNYLIQLQTADIKLKLKENNLNLLSLFGTKQLKLLH